MKKILLALRIFANAPKTQHAPFRQLQNNMTQTAALPVALHAVRMRLYYFASLAGYIVVAHNSYKSVGARVIIDVGTKWIAAIFN